jgi:hypothetical protein
MKKVPVGIWNFKEIIELLKENTRKASMNRASTILYAMA